MPLYLEYDKTNGVIKRIITADTLPINVAYLAYQEIPENIEIDTSLSIDEVLKLIVEFKKEQKDLEIPEEDEIEIIEV